MKILFTAFKGLHNTSFQLVNQLGRDSLFLTNSFKGLRSDICSIDCNYKAIYMFGIDKNLIGNIKIETCAKYNDEIIYTDFDVNSLENKLNINKIYSIVSSKPTGYLCNAAYYHMLKRNSNTIFIHIPSIKRIDNEMMKKLIEVFGDI